jgi:hypothetical protein
MAYSSEALNREADRAGRTSMSSFSRHRFMLEQGRLSVEEISRSTGYGDRERMRRSFLHLRTNAAKPAQRFAPACGYLIRRFADGLSEPEAPATRHQ